MAEAYIIDAVRTPRAIGKTGKGAYSGMHPQHLAATVLAALKDSQRDQDRRGRRHHLGHKRPDRPAGRRYRPDGGVGRGLSTSRPAA
jgi:hypothetical protein